MNDFLSPAKARQYGLPVFSGDDVGDLRIAGAAAEAALDRNVTEMLKNRTLTETVSVARPWILSPWPCG